MSFSSSVGIRLKITLVLKALMESSTYFYEIEVGYTIRKQFDFVINLLFYYLVLAYTAS